MKNSNIETILSRSWETIQAMQQKTFNPAVIQYDGTIKVCRFDKNEWARLSKAAFAAGMTQTATGFENMACMPEGARIGIILFDAMQTYYRNWLIEGFTTGEFENP